MVLARLSAPISTFHAVTENRFLIRSDEVKIDPAIESTYGGESAFVAGNSACLSKS